MAAVELRCESGTLLGVLDDGLFQVSCRATKCGKLPGRVIIHTFKADTGELVGTKWFREPKRRERTQT